MYGLGPEGRPDLGFGTTDADLEEAVRLIAEALTRLARAGLCVGSERTHPAADAAQRGNVSSITCVLEDTFPLSLPRGDEKGGRDDITG